MGGYLTDNCACSCNPNLSNDNKEINSQMNSKIIIKSKRKSNNCNIYEYPSAYTIMPLSNKITGNNLPRRIINSSTLSVIKEQHSENNHSKNNKPRLKGSRSYSSISCISVQKRNNQGFSNRQRGPLQNNSNIFDDSINDNWRNIDISTIISDNQLLSKDPKEIMIKGSLNKLIISHLFNNCSINVERFCLLTKLELEIYKSRENCLLIGKPIKTLKLVNIVNCKRIDFKCLNILKLQGFYYCYIEIARNENKPKPVFNSSIENIIKQNKDKQEMKNIIQREREETFFVFFSSDENIINQWVYIINFFLNKIK